MQLLIIVGQYTLNYVLLKLKFFNCNRTLKSIAACKQYDILQAFSIYQTGSE